MQITFHFNWKIIAGAIGREERHKKSSYINLITRRCAMDYIERLENIVNRSMKKPECVYKRMGKKANNFNLFTMIILYKFALSYNSKVLVMGLNVLCKLEKRLTITVLHKHSWLLLWRYETSIKSFLFCFVPIFEKKSFLNTQVFWNEMKNETSRF